MQSAATSPEDYILEVPDDRREYFKEVRSVILENLPLNFEECMNYGMIGYVVPLSVFPEGYHCNPALPLPFASIASQKNSINLYHMGIYSQPELSDWFKAEYVKITGKKPDMGKSCIRFSRPDKIPYRLIGELFTKLSATEWIEYCKKSFQRK